MDLLTQYIIWLSMWQQYVISMMFLPPLQRRQKQPESNQQTTQIEDTLQNNGPVLFKNVGDKDGGKF